MAPQYDEEAAAPSLAEPLNPRLLANGSPKKWRGSLCNCFAGCDLTAWGTCALSQAVPCVLFGLNMKKALRLSALWQALIYIFLFGVSSYTFAGSSAAAAAHCTPGQNTSLGGPPSLTGPDTPGCHQAQLASGIGASGMTLLGLLGVIYATYRRKQIREKFGIPGSTLGDFCRWFWCPACALCQETRTLWHNNVTDGVWLGPATTQARPATLPEYTAPSISSI